MFSILLCNFVSDLLSHGVLKYTIGKKEETSAIQLGQAPHYPLLPSALGGLPSFYPQLPYAIRGTLGHLYLWFRGTY